MWRGERADDNEVHVAPAHDPLDVLNAINRGSPVLFAGCPLANEKTGAVPNFVDEGELKYFDSKHVDITEVYTALHLYARNKRLSGRHFKLKTVVLSRARARWARARVQDSGASDRRRQRAA
eukprot:3736712-Prymnesium_polylepis.1